MKQTKGNIVKHNFFKQKENQKAETKQGANKREFFLQ